MMFSDSVVGSLWDARFCVSTWLVAQFGCAVCLWLWWWREPVGMQYFASHEGEMWLYEEGMRYRLRLWCAFRCCVYCTGDARFCVSTWLVAHFGCAVCLWPWWGKCVYCQCVMMFYVADGSLWDARFCVSTLGWKRGCGVEGMMLWRRMLSLSCPYDVSHGRLVIRS